MKRYAVLAGLGLLVSAGAAEAACTFDPAKGGLTTGGTGQTYPGAEGRPWFINVDAITVGGAKYERYGLSRVFGQSEFGVLERIGTFNGVMVLAEKGQAREVVYVPVSAAQCTFQPYQRTR